MIVCQNGTEWYAPYSYDGLCHITQPWQPGGAPSKIILSSDEYQLLMAEVAKLRLSQQPETIAGVGNLTFNRVPIVEREE